jgi:hypothetical protein
MRLEPLTMMRPDRHGFALPITILLIGLVTAGVLAAFSRIDSEAQVVSNTNAQVDAFTLAQAGLETALAANAVLPASTTYTLHGGSAVVQIQLIRPAVGTTPPLYVITSQGLPRKPAAQSQAQHIVSQYAYFLQGGMRVRSAWTSITGLTKSGGSGVLSGVDACGAQPSVAGVSVPADLYLQDGGTSVPSGTPAIEQMGTKTEMRDSINIDWHGIIYNNTIVPTVTIPGQNWPNFSNPNNWPIIRVSNGFTGSFTMPENGRGILIVEGNLTLAGNTVWNGVMLVGGRIVSSGSNTVSGAVVTGLNEKLGMIVGASDIGSGTKTFQYDSCAVARALSRLSTLQPIRNAWGDSWAAY